MLCSTAIALTFKLSESRDMNRYVITTANYMTASAVSLTLLLTGWWPGQSFDVDPGVFMRELPRVVGSGEGLFSWQGSFAWALVVGVPAGVFYFLGFVFLQRSVRENGVGISGSAMKLGILVPMVFSILLWRELPSGVQWAGIALAMSAILTATIPSRGQANAHARPSLLLLFACGGLAEFTNKLFQRYALVDLRSLFLAAVFTTALLVSADYLRRNHMRLTMRETVTGLLVGVPNLFASWFLILALSRLNTSVVFTLYSAGSIVLITLGGVALFGEQLRRREIAAICLTLVAVLLMNAGR